MSEMYRLNISPENATVIYLADSRRWNECDVLGEWSNRADDFLAHMDKLEQFVRSKATYNFDGGRQIVEYTWEHKQPTGERVISEPVYSDAERRLFRWFDMTRWLGTCSVSELYDATMIRAFRIGETGPYADALRSAAQALNACGPERLTPEFDRLITQHIGDE